MAYIMNEDSHSYASPSPGYFQTIHRGYESAGFDADILQRAVLNSISRREGQDDDRNC